tara:strand:+ start:3214 stop:3666 length:453 start_codon:yes stop_codon:yes gene_type:complete
MRKSGVSFSYTDQIPGYGANDNPLADILPDRPPPRDVPIDPGLGGGDGSGSPSGINPILPDEPPVVPIDPGLGGGDGSGSPSVIDPIIDTVPIDPGLIGEDSPAGIVRDPIVDDSQTQTPTSQPKKNGDFVLLGLASVVFFGSIIFGMRK